MGKTNIALLAVLAAGIAHADSATFVYKKPAVASKAILPATVPAENTKPDVSKQKIAPSSPSNVNVDNVERIKEIGKLGTIAIPDRAKPTKPESGRDESGRSRITHIGGRASEGGGDQSFGKFGKWGDKSITVPGSAPSGTQGDIPASGVPGDPYEKGGWWEKTDNGIEFWSNNPKKGLVALWRPNPMDDGANGPGQPKVDGIGRPRTPGDVLGLEREFGRTGSRGDVATLGKLNHRSGGGTSSPTGVKRDAPTNPGDNDSGGNRASFSDLKALFNTYDGVYDPTPMVTRNGERAALQGRIVGARLLVVNPNGGLVPAKDGIYTTKQGRQFNVQKGYIVK